MGERLDYDTLYRTLWSVDKAHSICNPRKMLSLSMCPTGNKINRVLEIGCGNGDVLKVLEQRYKCVVGCDISKFALSKMDKRFNVLLADAIKLPFRNNSFELIVAIDVLEHIENDRIAFESWTNLLMDGGILVLSVPYNQKLWDVDDEKVGHYRRYNYADIQNLATQNNLQLECIKYSGFPFYRVIRWILNRIGKYREMKYTTGCTGNHLASKNILILIILKIMIEIESCFQNLPYGTSITVQAKK